MNNANKIIVHQTIHGYNDGHNLLASSCLIPTEILTKMQILTDLTGNYKFEGFEHYLTAYPIKEIDSFAIAKTWYATEMKRPGCAWTHTFLINYDDLYYINSIAPLLESFMRPTLGEYSIYEIPLTFDINKLQKKHYYNNKINKDIIITILNAIYNLSSPLFIESSDSDFYEELLISIWLQLPPSIKYNFKFCTGSLEDRSTKDCIFDIQIIPSGSNNFYFRTNEKNILRDQTNVAAVFDNKFFFLFEDLENPGSLRNFLRAASDNTINSRKDISVLLNIYERIKNNCFGENNIKYILEILYNNYPSNLAAPSLKKLLFGNSKRKYFNVSDIELLNIINSNSKYSDMFFFEDIYSKKKLLSLFNNLSEYGIAEPLVNLLSKSNNSLTNYIYRTLIDNISEIEAPRYFSLNTKLALPLISRFPSLVNTSNLWYSNRYNKLEILDIILKNKINNPLLWVDTVKSLIDLGDTVLINNFIEKEPYLFLDSLENLFTNHFFKFPLHDIENVLSVLLIKQELLCSWYDKKNIIDIISLKLLLQFLDPNSNYITNEFAHKLASTFLKNKLDKNFCNEEYSFFLNFVQRGILSHEQTIDVIEICFPKVHFALSQDALQYKFWRYLEKHLPDIGAYTNWDKCERLRRGVTDLAISMSLETSYFANIISSMGIVSEIFKYCNTFSDGIDFLNKLNLEMKS